MREHAITATTRSLVASSPATRTRVRTRRVRRSVRYFAGLLSLAIGTLYALIASGVLQVLDPAVRAEQAPVFIPATAAAFFLLGTILLVAIDRRIVQGLGAAVQVITLVGYFAVATERTPSYEVWGLVIKALQVITLVALAYLALRGPRGVHRR